MTATRPRLLVSVRNAEEAEEALAGGADWIDLKEPRRGALGCVDAATARQVVGVVAGRAPVSAAAGELRDWPGAGAELLAIDGIALLKIGLSRCAGDVAWRHAYRDVGGQVRANGKPLAAVIYADAGAACAPLAGEVIEAAEELRCPWVLWDTFVKSGDGITALLDSDELAAQLAEARRRGMSTVVAGQLTIASLPLLPGGAFEMVAVRGAACGGARDSAVCRRHVAEFRSALTAANLSTPARG